MFIETETYFHTLQVLFMVLVYLFVKVNTVFAYHIMLMIRVYKVIHLFTILDTSFDELQ